MRLKPADMAPNSSRDATSTRADRSPASTRANPWRNCASGKNTNRYDAYSSATALPSASAAIPNWNACSSAVQRASWVSIADTKVSMCATKASARCAAGATAGGTAAPQAVRSPVHSAATAARLACDALSPGTNSGRAGSPARSSATLASNSRR